MIILDNHFPDLLTAFRIAEFNAYLLHFPEAEVHSCGLSVLNPKRTMREALREYALRYPHFRQRVHTYNPAINFQSRLIYTVFLANAFRFVGVAERCHTPFVFTLYPGGGFKLNDDHSDAMLRRVCSYPNLDATNVTTYNGLVKPIGPCSPQL